MPTVTGTVDAALEATVVLSFSRVGYAVRSRLSRWCPTDQLPGAGRTVVVTGANSGLGYATARALLDAGARVIVVTRDERKARATVQRLVDKVGSGAPVDHAWADLTDLAAVRALGEQLAAREARIDALVHNAGAMFPEPATTEDGLERTYQVHVVTPHLLTALLLPTLTASDPSRVVTVTSGGMYAEKLDVDRLGSLDGYRPTTAYARAKRAQVELTSLWQQRTDGAVDFHVVHPGWVLTPGVASSLPGFRKVMGPLLRSPAEGADSIVWAALSDEIEPGGQLWHDRTPRNQHKLPWTRTAPGDPDRLWTRVSRDAGIDVTT